MAAAGTGVAGQRRSPAYLSVPRGGGPARSQGGQRRYSRTEISRIEEVVGMAGEGFTLPAIRRVLGLQAEVAGLERQVAAEQASNSKRAGGA